MTTRKARILYVFLLVLLACKVTEATEGFFLSPGILVLRPFLVGWAARRDPPAGQQTQVPPKRFTPGMPYLNGDSEMDYLHRRSVETEPVKALDTPWDTVVFMVYVHSRKYVRVVGFSSAHDECTHLAAGPGVDYARDGYSVDFTLRDCKTGETLSARYPYRHWGSSSHIYLLKTAGGAGTSQP